MSRNGSGVYTKVNTFVAGTPITAAGHNANWDDIASEITNSVAADGQTPLTGPLKVSSGTAAAPGIAFASDLDTGIYRIGAESLGVAAAGSKVLEVSASGLKLPAAGRLYVNNNIIGEYQETVLSSGSAVSLTTNTAATITSLTLTAGEWDINGVVSFITAASTSVTGLAASISGTAATLDAAPGKIISNSFGAIVTGAGTPAFAIGVPDCRFILSNPSTTIYLVAEAFFSVSTLTGYGIIRARRIF